MKHLPLLLLAASFATSTAFANCDLTRYHWECDLPTNIKPSSAKPSLVYCDNTPVYLSTKDYDMLMRYQRADVNMSLTINDEFVEGPCIPAGR